MIIQTGITRTKLRVGDIVSVTVGKDSGKNGKIEQINLLKQTVLVEGINLVKKHMKSKGQQKGGIITVNKPIAMSNVMLICPSCNKKTRIGYSGTGKEKQRICKKCKAVITRETKKNKFI